MGLTCSPGGGESRNTKVGREIQSFQILLRIKKTGAFLAVQWLGFQAPNAGRTSLIPGWGTNPTFYTTWPKINKTKKKTNIEKIMLKELRDDQLHEGGVKLELVYNQTAMPRVCLIHCLHIFFFFFFAKYAHGC